MIERHSESIIQSFFQVVFRHRHRHRHHVWVNRFRRTNSMTTLCADIVKYTGLPCCRPVIDFTKHCGYHAVNKKTRTRRVPRMLEECAICYTNMLHTQPRQACGHRFHDRCIVRWLNTGRNTCPLCRMVLDDEITSDHEDDPTYMPHVRGYQEVHGGSQSVVENVENVHTVGSPGSALHNPILIDFTPNRAADIHSIPEYTPTTPNINHPTYTPVSPLFHFPVARRLVFETP